jgi:tetratricopeptide (TPR) repeat protein
VVIVATLFFSGPVIAQTREQLDWCNNKGDPTADLRIGGCTALIQSGKPTGKTLAIAFRLRGEAYADKKDYDQAIADYNQSISINPDDPFAYVYRGQAYYFNKAYAPSIKDYTKAIELKPDNASAWAYQGDTYYAMNEPEQALKNFAEAIKYEPNWMWPYTDRGELYLERGDYDLAIADFDRVIKLAPNYAMGWTDRCRALVLAGRRLEQAFDDCNEALKIDPKFVNDMVKAGSVSAIGDRALVRLKLGQFAAAIDDFDKALELTPKSAEALYGRGVAKQKKGDAAGGQADIGAAKAIQSGIVQKMAGFGFK